MKAKYTSIKTHSYDHGDSHTHYHDDSHIHEHHHGDGHIHTHEHEHDHPHDHEHGGDIDGISKDEKTLRILLAHWVDHNMSHQDGFDEWIEKAKQMEKIETAKYIQKAVEYMEKANEMLTEAKKSM